MNLLHNSVALNPTSGDDLSLSSRMDVVLPFLRLLALDALDRLVEETSSSFSAFELPSTEVQIFLNDISLPDFARVAAEVAVDFIPAEDILRRPLDSVVRPLSLPAERVITADHLPPALLAMVRQHMSATWGALGSIYLSDVLEWPTGSVCIVKELLASAIQWGLIRLEAEADLPGETLKEQVPGGRTPDDTDILRAFRIIATWASAVAGNTSLADALLLAVQAVALPPDVASARELLVTCDARSLASSTVTAYDPAAALQRVLQAVNSRELPVLLARPLSLLDPPTLGELGDRAGITRERIRQLEATGLRKLRAALGKPLNQAVLSMAEQFAARFGAAAPVAALLGSHPDALANDVRVLTKDATRARASSCGSRGRTKSRTNGLYERPTTSWCARQLQPLTRPWQAAPSCVRRQFPPSGS